MAVPSGNAPLWVSGVCDSMLLKVVNWRHRWPAGPVAATRAFMNKTGTVEAIPTKRAVKVAWHPKELEHLIRILKIARPDWQFVEDLELFYSSGLRIGRLLPNGLYLADMVAYSMDLDEIVEIVSNARAGRAIGGQLAEDVKSGSFWDVKK
jgi:hypothetical protein